MKTATYTTPIQRKAGEKMVISYLGSCTVIDCKPLKFFGFKLLLSVDQPIDPNAPKISLRELLDRSNVRI